MYHPTNRRSGRAGSVRGGAILLGLCVLSFLCGAGHGWFMRGRARTARAARVSRRPVSPRPPRPSKPPAGPVETDVLPLPGEFEPQTALLLAADEMSYVYPRLLVDIVRAARRTIPVLALARHPNHVNRIAAVLDAGGLPPHCVKFVVLGIDAPWVRDYGPIFLRRRSGELFLVDANYRRRLPDSSPRRFDDTMPTHFGKVTGIPVVSVPLEIEGGNILSNGEGLYVTSTETIRRNYPGRFEEGRAELLRLLPKYLGGTRWVFVRPLAKEATGHVDMFITFVAPNVAVVARCDPADDPLNAKILDAAAAALEGLPTSRGPMQVHRIPMPKVRAGWRTYTNVIFANGTLLMPTFQDVPPGMQDEALSLYARLLPGWRVVGIRCDELVCREGLLHCLCLHLPSYVPLDQPRRARLLEPDASIAPEDPSGWLPGSAGAAGP